MSRKPDYDRGHRDGLRAAVAALHAQAQAMNDPKARALLSAAADRIGKDGAHGPADTAHTAAPDWRLRVMGAAAELEGCIRAAAPALQPARDPDGRSLGHALFMVRVLQGTEGFPDTPEAAYDWLGYAHALTATAGAALYRHRSAVPERPSLTEIVRAALTVAAAHDPQRRWEDWSANDRDDFADTAQRDLGIPRAEHTVLPEDLTSAVIKRLP